MVDPEFASLHQIGAGPVVTAVDQGAWLECAALWALPVDAEGREHNIEPWGIGQRE
jgi:hypothetical protein